MLQNAYQQYKKSAIDTATPENLLIMLFDGALKFINQSIEAINAKDYEKSHNLLLKIQDIFDELMLTLDFDKGGEIAQNLFALYGFYRREVMLANVNKNISQLETVKGFLENMRTVWIEAVKLAKVGA